MKYNGQQKNNDQELFKLMTNIKAQIQETQRTLISPFKGRESVVNLLIDGQCRRKFRIENNSKHRNPRLIVEQNYAFLYILFSSDFQPWDVCLCLCVYKCVSEYVLHHMKMMTDNAPVQ